MDLSEIGQTLIVVLIMFFFLVLSVVFRVFLRTRRGQKTPLGMAVTLLSEVNQNQELIESFSYHRQTKKFKIDSWQKNKSKLDFLPQELRTTLSDTFGMAEDFNQKMDAARKHKSDSYMASINVRKLKPLLDKSKQGLEQWLQANMENPEYFPRRRGLFG